MSQYQHKHALYDGALPLYLQRIERCPHIGHWAPGSWEGVMIRAVVSSALNLDTTERRGGHMLLEISKK
jgi:hypothetical protein